MGEISTRKFSIWDKPPKFVIRKFLGKVAGTEFVSDLKMGSFSKRKLI
jgi:hypothetical protein